MACLRSATEPQKGAYYALIFVSKLMPDVYRSFGTQVGRTLGSRPMHAFAPLNAFALDCSLMFYPPSCQCRISRMRVICFTTWPRDSVTKYKFRIICNEENAHLFTGRTDAPFCHAGSCLQKHEKHNKLAVNFATTSNKHLVLIH